MAPHADAAVSVVIVTYFTGPALTRCLASVAADSGIGEAIVVVNGATAETMAALDAWTRERPDRRLLAGHGNVGFARGCNLGAAAATRPYVLFLNPDAALRPGASQALVSAVADAPAPALAGGHLLNADGTPQKGARREALTPWRALVSGSGLSRFERATPLFRDLHRHRDPLPKDVTPIAIVSGAFMLMRRGDFLAIGGFDEGYFLHVDDIDLCTRVTQAGGVVLFQPHAVAVHEGGTSAAPSSFVALQKARGFRRFFRKNAKSTLGRLGADLVGAALEAAVRLRARLRGEGPILPPP
ncbi:MAG: glycosyltransferase [Alphaproteobacteria bacterium]|nr:glycosyltransferase [Alphaproteobacteria bacterium]